MKWFKDLSPKNIRLLILGVLIVASAFVYEEVADDVFSDPAHGDPETLVFDKAVLKMFLRIRGEHLNQSMMDMTALGSFSVICFMTLALIVFLVAHKDKRGLLYVVLMSIGPLSIPTFLKNYYMRARPDVLEHLANVQSASFPSGHSFGATVAYLSLAFLVSREIKEIKLEILYYAMAFVVIGIVGFSRMFLGVHYPTDVVAGISLGMIWFSLVSIPFIYFSKTSKVVE